MHSSHISFIGKTTGKRKNKQKNYLKINNNLTLFLIKGPTGYDQTLEYSYYQFYIVYFFLNCVTIYLDRFNLFSKTFKEQIVKLVIYVYQKRVNYDFTEFIIAQNLNRQKAFVSVN